MELMIELTNHNIEIMEYKLKKGKMIINKKVSANMPQGVLEKGIIVNMSAVVQQIKQLLKEHQIRTKIATLCVNEMDIIKNEITVPKGNHKQTRGLIEMELKRSDNFEKGFVFDFVLSRYQEDIENMLTYTVYLLHEDLIKIYETTLARAGLILEAIVPVSHSMERMSELLKLKKKSGLTILISAEEDGINLLLVGEGIKEIHRSLDMNESNIATENIFILSSIPAIQTSKDGIGRVVDGIGESVSKLVQFRSQTSVDSEVERILIYGPLAKEEGFIERVEERCGIPSFLCELPKEKVKLSSGIKNDSLRYNGIGAKCGIMEGIKREVSFFYLSGSKLESTIKEYAILLTGVAAILILTISYAFIGVANNNIERENKALEKEIAAIEIQEEYQRKKALQEEINTLIEYNNNSRMCIEIMQQNVRFEASEFSKIDRLLPSTMSISSYTFNGNIVLQCLADDQDGPADLARILTNAGIFEEVKYTGFTTTQEIDGVTRYSFQLECKR